MPSDVQELAEHLRLLVPLGCVPDGSLVTKRTGNKTYTVRRTIVIYGAEQAQQRIHADAGVVFLADEGGSFNALPASTEVIWSVDAREVMDRLEDQEAERESK